MARQTLLRTITVDIKDHTNTILQRRLGSTPNAAWLSGNLEPRSRLGVGECKVTMKKLLGGKAGWFWQKYLTILLKALQGDQTAGRWQRLRNLSS